jgi:hypothetical protein
MVWAGRGLTRRRIALPYKLSRMSDFHGFCQFSQFLQVHDPGNCSGKYPPARPGLRSGGAGTTPENASNSNGLRGEAEVMDGNEQAGSAIRSGLQG